MKTYATYLRVSTQKQGRTMLGIEAQRKMCADFIAQGNSTLAMEFVDIESGTHRNRKGLQDAIAFCKQNECGLVIAKLDRLARDVEFCFKVINTGIDIHFCDMPQINTLLLGVFASVAQYERELTADRTKKALAVKKAQGCKLGASSPKYKETLAKKSNNEIKEMHMKQGNVKTQRYLESRDSVAFLKAIKRAFPKFTEDEDPKKWYWGDIRFRCGKTEQVLAIMRDFKEMDSEGKVFAKWDFNDPRIMQKMRSHLWNFKQSITKH